jgi:hypothetical protein
VLLPWHPGSGSHSSTQKPVPDSCPLYAGRRPSSHQAPDGLIPVVWTAPGFDDTFGYRRVFEGLLSLSFRTPTCPESYPGLFFRCSPLRLFTAAARTGLRPAPESRSRWAYHHLLRSFTSRFSSFELLPCLCGTRPQVHRRDTSRIPKAGGPCGQRGPRTPEDLTSKTVASFHTRPSGRVGSETSAITQRMVLRSAFESPATRLIPPFSIFKASVPRNTRHCRSLSVSCMTVYCCLLVTSSLVPYPRKLFVEKSLGRRAKAVLRLPHCCAGRPPSRRYPKRFAAAG